VQVVGVHRGDGPGDRAVADEDRADALVLLQRLLSIAAYVEGPSLLMSIDNWKSRPWE
jgi:hypothetical protein